MKNSSTIKSGLIEVVFSDGTKGRMAPKALDVFLRADKILRFKRATGWVIVGIHPVRGEGRAAVYRGPERRSG